VIADDVEADEEQALIPDYRAHLGGDPAFALGELDADALGSRGEIAPCVALRRHPGERVGYGLAVDQQYALVAVPNLGEESLRHDVASLVLRHGLEDDVGVGAARGHAKDRRTAHAVQRLDDDGLLDSEEFVEARHLPGDDRRRTALGKPGGVHLLVGVAQALGFVDDEHACLLGAFEEIGRVDVLHVEGGVLAHQHDVELRERARLRVPQVEPVLLVVAHRHRAHASVADAVTHIEILHLHVLERPTPGLGRQKHGQRGVFLDGDL
jgi:hypothetical protein